MFYFFVWSALSTSVLEALLLAQSHSVFWIIHLELLLNLLAWRTIRWFFLSWPFTVPKLHCSIMALVIYIARNVNSNTQMQTLTSFHPQLQSCHFFTQHYRSLQTSRQHQAIVNANLDNLGHEYWLHFAKIPFLVLLLRFGLLMTSSLECHQSSSRNLMFFH